MSYYIACLTSHLWNQDKSAKKEMTLVKTRIVHNKDGTVRKVVSHAPERGSPDSDDKTKKVR